MDKLSEAVAENVLTLLIWSDKHSRLVADAVPSSLYSSKVYRDIAGAVNDYVRTHGVPPKEHVADLIEEELQDKEKGELYKKTIDASAELSKSINAEYVIGRLEQFVRQQRLRGAIIEASDAIGSGDIDEAEKVLLQAMKQRLNLFDSGLTLLSGLDTAFAMEEVRDVIPMGIPELDRHFLGPARKELHLLLGPHKSGKSWHLTNLAKRALLLGRRVCVVTLEVSANIWHQRVVQALLSMTKRHEEEGVLYVSLHKNDDGKVETSTKRIKAPSFSDKKLKEKTKKSLAKWEGSIYIKEFPTGVLTMSALQAYLEGLEAKHKFFPDLLLLDYADLMKIDRRDYRLSLDELLQQLRGEAVTRNMALATVSQVNREGIKKGSGGGLVTGVHAAEHIGRLALADTTLTYSQTPAERALNLARLYVENSRNEMDKIAVVIGQAYVAGQFVLCSAPLPDDYWKRVVRKEEEQEES